MAYRILLADDDRLAAASLRILIERDENYHVAGLAQSADEAAALFRQEKPDVALLDIRMGDTNGIDAAETILAEFPDACILFLTTFKDAEYIRRALRLGVHGYLLKQNYEGIVPALDAALAGQAVYGSEILASVPQALSGDLSASKREQLSRQGLTERECDAVEYVAQGMNNKEIAAALFLSEGTVRNLISLSLDKLDVRDRTQLAIYYLQLPGETS